MGGGGGVLIPEVYATLRQIVKFGVLSNNQMLSIVYAVFYERNWGKIVYLYKL